MELGSSEIRQRKGISKIVEDFDIFEKVVENVKEEKKVSAGASKFLFYFLFLLNTLICKLHFSFLYLLHYNFLSVLHGDVYIFVPQKVRLSVCTRHRDG